MSNACPRTFLTTAVIVFHFLSSVSLGQEIDEPSKAKLLAKADPALLQWLDNVQKLEWAEFEITGKYSRVIDKEGNTFGRDISQKSWCSPTVNRHETLWNESAHPTRGRHGGVWLDYGDRIVEWPNTSSPAAVMRIMPVDRTVYQGLGKAIEPRLVAMFGGVQIPSTPGFEDIAFGYVVSRECETLPSEIGLSVLGIRPRQYVRRGARYKRELITFSQEEGYSPQEVVTYDVSVGNGDEGFERQRVSNKFARFGEIWLPTETTISQFSPRYDKGPATTYVLRINWISVNKKLPSSLFDVNSFGAKVGHPVNDYRLAGKGITVSHIGKCQPDGLPLPPSDLEL